MVKDKLMEVYNLLKADSLISEKCEGRIKFYDYPETADTSKAFMIITPLDVPVGYTHGSNKELTTEFIYQVDIQSHVRIEVKEIQAKVKEIMQENGFSQLSNGLDTYFKETDRFVDARRYVGTSNLYDTNY